MSTAFDFIVETITADGQRTQTEAHGHSTDEIMSRRALH
jgi:hypothetical protein